VLARVIEALPGFKRAFPFVRYIARPAALREKRTPDCGLGLSSFDISKMASSSNTEDVGAIFFWHDDEVPYGFLSQWYTSAFTSPSSSDVVFRTAEQYMMYQKALLFNDQDTAVKVLQAASPAKQKKLGREVKGFDAETWDRERERIVEDGNCCKFVHSEAGTGLKEKLLDTGKRELVEVRCWQLGVLWRLC